MKCDKLKAYKADVTIPVYGTIADAPVYLKEKADEAIAELKAENEQLKKKSSCTFSDDCLRVRHLRRQLHDAEAAETERKIDYKELERKFYEAVKESPILPYHPNKKILRALWLARAERARAVVGEIHNLIVCMRERHPNMTLSNTESQENVWQNVGRKCLKKAEEYK